MSDTIPILNDIVFVNASMGWAVGDSGTILHTSNGGETWSYQESGTTANLNSIYIMDENNGWIAADSNIMLYTENGGTVGINDLSPRKNNINIFPNPSNNITNINFDFDFELEDQVSISISSISGLEIKQIQLGIKKTGNYELNCAEFTPGIYFVTLKTDSGKLTKKLINE